MSAHRVAQSVPVSPPTLLELAERCEKATGPDRELDITIAVAIDFRHDDWEDGERTAREMAERHGLAWLVSRSVEGYNSTWRHLPRYTASLDAAMTLVPEGCFPDVCRSFKGHWASNCYDYERAINNRAEAATPALALCAAALRAQPPSQTPWE